jgi:hypothetical protein
MSDKIKADKFRPRSPNYQRWTMPTGVDAKTWVDMLYGTFGITKLDPESIAGFRIQVNFKRKNEVQP